MRLVNANTHTDLLVHTHLYTSEHRNLWPCALLAFKNAGIIIAWFVLSSGFTTLQKYSAETHTHTLTHFFSGIQLHIHKEK